MVKVRITPQGIIEEQGSGFEGTAQTATSTTKTATATLTNENAGVVILSASAGALTMTLPTVASCVGQYMIIRSTSPSAHILTSSQDAGNVIFGGTPGVLNATGSNASKITFPALEGACVGLLSTGAHWMMLACSGTMTLAKGA